MCALCLWRNWDFIDEHVAVGGLPTRHDASELARRGVRGVINLCEEFRGPEAEFERLGVKRLRMPTTDYHGPADVDVRRGLEFIEQHASGGARVLIHCKAGRKRSPLLAMCWMMRRHGLSPGEAYDAVRRARPQVDRGLDRHATIRSFVERR